MPIYRYENLATGEIFEEPRPIADRDIPGCKRLVPTRIGNIISHLQRALTTDQQTQKTIREMEIRGDLKSLSKHEQKTLKDVWYTDKYNAKAPKTALAPNLITS